MAETKKSTKIKPKPPTLAAVVRVMRPNPQKVRDQLIALSHAAYAMEGPNSVTLRQMYNDLSKIYDWMLRGGGGKQK